MGVSCGGLDLKDAILNGQKRHIEGTATQIENEDVSLTLPLLVKPVCNGSGSGLVDDSHDVEASNGPCVLGGLSLTVVEIGRDSNHCVLDLSAEIVVGDLLHLGEDHGGDLLRVEGLGLVLVVDDNLGLVALSTDDLEGPVLHVRLHSSLREVASDESLRIEDGVFGISGHLVLRSVSDQTLSVSEGHIGGSGTVSLVVSNDLHSVVLPDTDTGVGSSKINSDRGTFSGHFQLADKRL
mmetsp:Transcript_38825/g.76331  ORF Transcript_38825/g.76331 Transcript_38825/m.76331 type:complete len:238 (+) Transcript_38825:1835-2548(+)